MSRVKQETLDFIDFFSEKYKMSLSSTVGYRQVRGGKWTWEIDSWFGNERVNNKTLNYFPLFEDDIEASEACILLCKAMPQFKCKGHVDGYDFLPLC